MISQIDRAIKESWIYSIKGDYFKNYLLLEDSLKNAFYYHLRNRLTDAFLEEHNLRIYTELHTGFGERIDIAIVKIKDEDDNHLRDKIIEYVAVIELKHKGGQVNINPFNLDIKKMRTYIGRKKNDRCQYYLGFIHEAEYGLEETAWLNPRSQNSWAQGKLTELSGFKHDDNMIFTIVSYNELNEDLNNMRG